MPLLLWTTERREGKAEKVGLGPEGWEAEVESGILVVVEVWMLVSVKRGRGSRVRRFKKTPFETLQNGGGRIVEVEGKVKSCVVRTSER